MIIHRFYFVLMGQFDTMSRDTWGDRLFHNNLFRPVTRWLYSKGTRDWSDRLFHNNLYRPVTGWLYNSEINLIESIITHQGFIMQPLQQNNHEVLFPWYDQPWERDWKLGVIMMPSLLPLQVVIMAMFSVTTACSDTNDEKVGIMMILFSSSSCYSSTWLQMAWYHIRMMIHDFHYVMYHTTLNNQLLVVKWFLGHSQRDSQSNALLASLYGETTITCITGLCVVNSLFSITGFIVRRTTILLLASMQIIHKSELLASLCRENTILYYWPLCGEPTILNYHNFALYVENSPFWITGLTVWRIHHLALLASMWRITIQH